MHNITAPKSTTTTPPQSHSPAPFTVDDRSAITDYHTNVTREDTGISDNSSRDGGQSSDLLSLPSAATDPSSNASNNSSNGSVPPVKKVSRFQVSIVREGRSFILYCFNIYLFTYNSNN